MLRRAMMGAGGSAPPAGTVWDAAAKGSSIVISNAGRDAENASGWNSVLATTAKSSGKWQFGIECINTAGNQMAGIGDQTSASGGLNAFLGNTAAFNSVGYAVNGTYKRLSSAGTTTGSYIGWGAGDHVTCVLDLDASPPTFTSYVNVAAAQTTTLPSGRAWRPGCSIESGGKMRLHTASLPYPITGYTEWDG